MKDSFEKRLSEIQLPFDTQNIKSFSSNNIKVFTPTYASLECNEIDFNKDFIKITAANQTPVDVIYADIEQMITKRTSEGIYTDEKVLEAVSELQKKKI